MRVVIVTPAPPGARSGNETTTNRWKRILEGQGHEVAVLRAWEGEPCDALIALHARKSADSILRFLAAHPSRPLIVALTGTDVYGDFETHPKTWESVSAATRLILLQPLAALELPAPARSKSRVVYQSVPRIVAPAAAAKATFDVCVLAHLREVKDPFRAAAASRLLPADSRIRILQVGGALSDGMEARARAEEGANPRYRWLGSLPRDEALEVLATSDVMVNSSEREGGANAVGEALAASVPVVASRIPGNIGLLGETYPGYFAVGDSRALARLLSHAERDAAFLAVLRAHCVGRQTLFEPWREEEAWAALLDDALHASRDAARAVEDLGALMRSMVGPDPAGLRRFPRMDVKGRGEVELWPRAAASHAKPLVVPVELRNVSPNGILAEVPDHLVIDPDRLAMISVRLSDSALVLPGRVVWASTNGTPRMGVQLQLEASLAPTRQAYVEWLTRAVGVGRGSGTGD